MKTLKSYDRTWFVIGQIFSIMWGFLIIYEHLHNDRILTVLGATIIIIGFRNLKCYFDRKAE